MHEPEAMWKVTWFHFDKYFDVEVQAPNPELARTFSLRSTSEQEGIRMTELMFIRCERIG